MKPKSSWIRLIGWLLILACFAGPLPATATLRAEDLRLAVFDVDVTPPVGGVLAYDPVKAQGELGLRGRGVILLGAGEPIVLCAMDWIGLANEGYDAFRQGLAEAAGTTPQHVAVHTVHQHDAPECDFGTEKLLRERGLPLGRYEGSFARDALERLTAAVRSSLSQSMPVTHIGLGRAEVREVASNRRILGPDGKVHATRYTATKNAALRAEPEGTIDPILSVVSFWNGEQPLAVLSYYACHPQSYYRTGIANPDFPGIARFLRQQQVPDALHVHFNGAGGNLGAGKYNDGAHTNRWVLAQRLADGMKRAWEATQKLPLGPNDVGWEVEPVALPPAAHLNESQLEEALRGSNTDLPPGTASELVWLRRCRAGYRAELSCLRLGPARVLHMPGELFVEYQLAAKQMRPDLFIAMAAYGDYGPGYIGTARAYQEGGYETSPRASHVAPEVEAVLLDGMRKLLRDNSRSGASAAESPRNMVATVHPLATEAGVGVMQRGGNAVDAAIAAALTLGVVDGFNSGIGGGCFILIRTADGRVVAIDGREMAPAAAHRDMYLVNGKPDTTLSQIGPLAIAVPGALKAYEQAVREHGKTEFSDLIADAARIAQDGFEVTHAYSQNLEATKTHLQKYPGSRAALLKDDGSVYQPGEVFRQPDLAHTYRQIAEHGVDWFYRGLFARRCAGWLQANGGIITERDFQDYTTIRREPIKSTYRGYTVCGFPPPSSGGVHVAEILNILEHFDLASLYKRDRTKFVHVVAEAMKLAFADRAYWLGDPDFAQVPRGLIDKKYAARLAAKIDLNRVTAVDSYGTPPRADAEFFERHTTHIAAADAAGNWVAITTTVNTTFGSKVIVPGLGVVMNNQMDDFSIAPGTPNAFGLVGNEANSVQPGKRPLSSMSPTIILKDGQPIMTVGAAGGPKIITQVLLAIIRRIDLGMDLADAVGGKRFHHQWSPDRLLIEDGFDAQIVEELNRLGHSTAHSTSAGITQAIIFDPQKEVFTGIHDPRTAGSAKGL